MAMALVNFLFIEKDKEKNRRMVAIKNAGEIEFVKHANFIMANDSVYRILFVEFDPGTETYYVLSTDGVPFIEFTKANTMVEKLYILKPLKDDKAK